MIICHLEEKRGKRSKNWHLESDFFFVKVLILCLGIFFYKLEGGVLIPVIL